MNSHFMNNEAPDFSDPLGLLRACHQRIQAQCETLERIVAHLKEHEVDAQTREACTQVLRYFNTAAKQHHADEEENLYPLLSRQSLKLADIVHRLKQQHSELERAWEDLQARLGKPASLSEDLEAFATTVEHFCHDYREHIALEEEELLFMAQHILGPDELRSLGNAMAERRGQTPRYY